MATEGSAARASAIQRYRFVRRLATGGMAEVYVADAVGVAGVKKRVALKRILPNLASDKAFVTMFLNEARVASTLQHPNIVQTYDVIDDRGEYYIAMELLEGVTLQEFRQRLHQLQLAPTPAQVLYIVDRVLAGLHYAHERRTPAGRPLNVVHRDVSPHNVFLTHEGNVKLLDFGVAKVEAVLGPVTESGVVKGKVLYMSPEQCQGLDIDRTSDLYTTGALLYTLLTGHHPYRGANPYDTMRAIIHERPPSLASVAPHLEGAIDQLVSKAMAKEPTERFKTARDMQRAIAAVVRERGWFLTDLDFAAFVESVLRYDRPVDPDVKNLPADLVIGDQPVEELPDEPPRAATRPDTTVAETEHALVERVRGVTVLTLRGVLDERFDTSIGRHLRGVVLVDTEDVSRVTSYGIRALLDLVEGSAGQVDAVYHLRCSVAFIQQVSMIRKLLMGGKVVSFHLPYVDPVTGQPFLQVAAGASAAAFLESRVPPPAACPGDPERAAEFDEDPESYLFFGEDFLAAPPQHVAAVIESLAAKEKRRQVEKEITAAGLVVYIRRPIDEGFRWRTLLAGVEGKVRLDLQATPTWTDAGLARLTAALADEADRVETLELTHMPLDLYLAVRRHPRLGRLLRAGSIRVHAHCRHCDAPRRLALELSRLARMSQDGRVFAPCPACGNELLLDPGPAAEARPAPPAPPPAEPQRYVLVATMVSGVAVLCSLTLALLVALAFHFAT